MEGVAKSIGLTTSSPYIYEESFLKFLSLFIVAAGNHLRDMELSIVIGIRGQRLYSKKNIVYAGVDYNSNYLIVYFIVSYPPPQQRSLLLAEHFCICLLIFKTTNRKRESMEKGEDRDES